LHTWFFPYPVGKIAGNGSHDPIEKDVRFHQLPWLPKLTHPLAQGIEVVGIDGRYVGHQIQPFGRIVVKRKMDGMLGHEEVERPLFIMLNYHMTADGQVAGWFSEGDDTYAVIIRIAVPLYGVGRGDIQT
jgi:hypothetical protein